MYLSRTLAGSTGPVELGAKLKGMGSGIGKAHCGLELEWGRNLLESVDVMGI